LFSFVALSQRGTGKTHNEDAVLLDDQILQGTVREHGEVDASQPRYFAIADGVAIGTRPRTASRRLLELLQSRLATAKRTEPLSPLLHRVQQDYVALGMSAQLHGMASTLVGVRLIDNAATIFNVGDSRAYVLAKNEVLPLSRDHILMNDLLDSGEITLAQADYSASILCGLTSQFIADSEVNDFKVNVVTHLLEPGQRLLLCSDGLNEALSDAQIGKLFAQDAGEVDLALVHKAARHHGGTDDFSVIVLAPLED
jgi:serine/threonine protein phosphatase PrpC